MTNFDERAVPGFTSNFLMQEAISRYLFAKKYIGKKDSVLDMATGTGYGANILSAANSVIGVDLSDEALAFAKKHYVSPNLSFMKMDACEMLFKDDCFDAIVAFEMIEHLKKPKVFLAEVKRLMKPGGVFIVSTPNSLVQSPNGLLMSPYHIKEYAPHELTKLLALYFGKVEIFGQKKNQKAEESVKEFMKSQHVRQFLVDVDLFGIRKLVSRKKKEKYWQSFGSFFGRGAQEMLDTSDFVFSKNKIDECEYIIAVCRK